MNTKKILIVFCIALLFFATGYYFPHNTNDKTDNPTVADLSSDYPLLAKRIFIEDPNEPIISFSPLRQAIATYFNEKQINGGLYFEYLPTGTSIRVGSDDRRIAASLIKLPFAMEAYYAKEKGIIDFNDEIVITEDMINDQFGNLYKEGVGTRVSIREALNRMLKDSDNTALKVLAFAVEGKVSPENGPFNFLDAEFQQNEDLTISLTPRAYSSFLKCLYFSCYNTKEDSQEILELLSNTNLNTRIPAGVPDTVTVSHKVGNFYNQTQSDCGIVYVPKRNYALCMMVDEPDSETTDTYFADISKMTYDYVVGQ
jgi:beta-lactamase class A